VAGRPYNQTGVRVETLLRVGECLTRVPDDFTPHPEIKKLLAARTKALATGKGVTMALAEALAFGCLMSKYSPDTVPGLRALSKENRTLKVRIPPTAPSFSVYLTPLRVVDLVWCVRDPSIHLIGFFSPCTGTCDNQSAALGGGLGAHGGASLDVEMQEHPTVHVRLSGQVHKLRLTARANPCTSTLFPVTFRLGHVTCPFSRSRPLARRLRRSIERIASAARSTNGTRPSTANAPAAPTGSSTTWPWTSKAR
jgi:hypothetical protein